MKKTYFGRRNALIPGHAALIGGAFLAVALLALVLRLVFPGSMVAVAGPFWRLSAAVGDAVHSGSAAFSSPAELQSKLDSASAENAALQNQNKTLAAQVVELQKLLGSRADVPPAILASVSARPPESPYDTLVIDQGSRAGVVVDALVTGPGGVPVGRIASVNAASARVLLFSAPDVKTDAWAGQGKVPITLTGAGGGAFEAVAGKDATLVEGDTVYTADSGAAAMGTIVRLDRDPSSTAITLRIQPLANPFTLTWVLVSRT